MFCGRENKLKINLSKVGIKGSYSTSFQSSEIHYSIFILLVFQVLLPDILFVPSTVVLPTPSNAFVCVFLQWPPQMLSFMNLIRPTWQDERGCIKGLLFINIGSYLQVDHELNESLTVVHLVH